MKILVYPRIFLPEKGFSGKTIVFYMGRNLPEKFNYPNFVMIFWILSFLYPKKWCLPVTTRIKTRVKYFFSGKISTNNLRYDSYSESDSDAYISRFLKKIFLLFSSLNYSSHISIFKVVLDGKVISLFECLVPYFDFQIHASSRIRTLISAFWI